MAVQVAISWFGYKAIAAFEQWTVPPTIVVLVADVGRGLVRPGHRLGLRRARPATSSKARDRDRRDERRHDGHRHRLGHHLVHLRGRLLPLRQHRSAAAQALPRQHVLGQFIPVVWLGVLGATPGDEERRRSTPASSSSRTSASLAIPVLLLVLHGPDRHQHPEHLHLLRRHPGAGHQDQPPQAQPVRRRLRAGRRHLLHLPGELRRRSWTPG